MNENTVKKCIHKAGGIYEGCKSWKVCASSAKQKNLEGRS